MIAKAMFIVSCLLVNVILSVPMMAQSEPLLSRDDDLLAVVLEQVDGFSQLALISPEGDEVMRIPQSLPMFDLPEWSPDGRAIAYFGMVEGEQHVFVLTAASDTPRQLTFNTNFRNLAGWHPDGQGVLVSEYLDEGSIAQVIYLPIDGSEPQVLLEMENYIGAPAVSPDGTTLAYVQMYEGMEERMNMGELMLRNLDTGETRSIAPMDAEFPYIVWSPDGSRLVFNAYDDSLPQNLDENSPLVYLYDVESDTVKRLAPTLMYPPYVAAVRNDGWSADGTRLLVICFGDPNMDAPDVMWIIDVNSGRAAQSRLGYFSDATWSPDNNRIAYIDSQRLLHTAPADNLRDGAAISSQRFTAVKWRPAPGR